LPSTKSIEAMIPSVSGLTITACSASSCPVSETVSTNTRGSIVVTSTVSGVRSGRDFGPSSPPPQPAAKVDIAANASSRARKRCMARDSSLHGEHGPAAAAEHCKLGSGAPSKPLSRRPVLELACLDLEGVLIPEVWINFAERTGIDELRATTRDIPDYDVLMRQRLRILAEHRLGLPDIQEVIAGMKPLDGALEFLDWLRERFQVIILSDTFYQFAEPFMRQLEWPTLFCHQLEVDSKGMVVDYHLRQEDPKRNAVIALKKLNFRVIATGDSYNDTTMLAAADAGILYRPPQNVIDEFPQYPVATNYDEARVEWAKASIRDV
jgi:phosphoserine/homoserine phosphotransferase